LDDSSRFRFAFFVSHRARPELSRRHVDADDDDVSQGRFPEEMLDAMGADESQRAGDDDDVLSFVVVLFFAFFASQSR